MGRGALLVRREPRRRDEGQAAPGRLAQGTEGLMCGIAGVALGPHVASTDLPKQLAAMADAMVARGPDDGGVYFAPDGRVGLANRRLAIRDLSPAGHMPMANADGTVWITYNGELYNADELRAQLGHLGFRFLSQADTEVILHGYEAWGRSVVRHLRGMFAFGIHDTRGRGSLLLARDPLGIKPLYYAWRDSAFIFASECQGVLAAGRVTRELNPAGLVAYLELGSVPAPLTIYKDIHALEAGHALTVSCEPNALHVEQPITYWQLPEPRDSVLGYGDAVDQVRAQLLDSVRRHLVSDVPLGAFLSGGLDSGSIVALMRQANPTGVLRTCSVVFAEPDYNEAAYASDVAARFETEHIEVAITPRDLDRELEHILQSLDQPSNDGINTYFVSQAARQASLTVALSGLGGDELFGGYPTFQRLPRVLSTVRPLAAVPGATLAVAAALSVRGRNHPGARLAGWLRRGGADAAVAYLGLRGLFSPASVSELVQPVVLAEADRAFDLPASLRAALESASHTHPWDATSRLELSCYMRHQLLRDTDVMSMAHSLEVRVPFIDHEVVEFVLGLPLAVRRSAIPKQLLRDAVPWLPERVRNRRDKQGFTFPLGEWLSGPLRPRFHELVHVAATSCKDYLQPGAADGVLRAFDQGKTHWSRPWALAALYGALRGGT